MYTLFFLLLIVLYFVSFVLFIKSRSRNQRTQLHQSQKIEQKLDQIIALLKENKKEQK
ncbi:DUF4083 family protein [Sporosarcina sp. Te-1]|uniref:DUF4083 family protein n=1 Tax=Sporosarcina sp. Te-1 TaxID=2818390 RepID=UPI001A9DD440|nr:DUF4083 family protein [Sporosarcina sp. Te-1]QTD43305.1 DUF4083 family protein [Sporosarcina sp. Te-1]